MKKILIANRGEIALRIVRACKDAGYTSVAIASEADRQAMHARSADECHVLKGNAPRETYLNQEAILAIAARAGVDAVHPGYGLLSENETFAAAAQAAGLIWIGPSPEAIAQLGDKVAARAIARRAGAPLLPSWEEDELTTERARLFVEEHGLPVIVKAQNGGGGRGMRIVRHKADLEGQIAAARREAELAFGRPECFIERYIEHARHIETQCLADAYGSVAVVSTRDCTLQRRHQKLVEEAPAPFLTPEQTARLTEASSAVLSAVGYQGAATCEFLLTSDGDIFFLEVNTRIQVEHPVTEEVTGVDLIREMFRIAEGEPLPASFPAVRGHAIEFRINAEDPWADFRPTPGHIAGMQLPAGPGVRIDFGYADGDTVPPYYDSMIGKVIVAGQDRADALARARRALGELRVAGLTTITPLHQAILISPEFSAPVAEDFKVHTRWIDAELERLAEAAKSFTVGSAAPAVRLPEALPDEQELSASSETEPPPYRIGIKAPLSGLIMEVCVQEGDAISPGDTVAIMEAMKMEQPVVAEIAGIVAKINVGQGSFIEMDADIMGVN
ncbi:MULTISPECIES: biotin carboxylase N-terminal domain-containing protein [unclassified Mesorhizobium]|uniref:acetyl/propionyl/methylcrotonyl-CoA carboxylase subunit alpha n=1 Tax=unclassified Mesorhizobium TaxID=325217 RepID=UPI000FCC4135|nr:MULTISPECIES: biotin carboxylase N-terminal domain-containing protein [unclassified Mesorhizobium]TGP18194.1 ATP-grasp domain-containing protein [Mesorhizobium sp. M1D.F.Ca.ET.231.01.1.1]TGP25432.1 ATP-grasp domain-containing protein [Mesorhizobium sp. M1D.F.Ca.ET.234.01.1.1]TGS38318.1 ATP-grasp domain-containing protein [Mesorhizobium sp. M1D.F.Ca.ET.184.01.1.1]TGS58325.1 ATP-grasp domain-containing protein [Mesorhizobium sp. M1D.F.Ca.ET.183.01.1.1]